MIPTSPASPIVIQEKAMPVAVEALLDFFAWLPRLYRRLRGGKWELWSVAHPVNALCWHSVNGWHVNDAMPSRPTALCRGRPIAMEWKGKLLDVPICIVEDCDNKVMMNAVEEKDWVADGPVGGYIKTVVHDWEPHAACHHHTPGFS